MNERTYSAWYAATAAKDRRYGGLTRIGNSVDRFVVFESVVFPLEMTQYMPVKSMDMMEATAAIALWASSPPMPDLIRARLLTTLSAAWEVADPMAARNPTSSKEDEFQEAIATPTAIGMRDKSDCMDGSASRPFSMSVIMTVISGIEHFEVYVKLIPIRSSDILLQ